MAKRDFQNGMEANSDASIIARLKSIAERTMFREGVYITIFLVCSDLAIPIELEKMITIFDIPLPEDKEIQAIINDYAKGFQITIDPDTINELVMSFRGLSGFEIRQILNLAYQRSGMIDGKDKELILKEKAFGGQGGGSDVITRLFGQFLTWLQEKESSVYVVATSNDISALPPEFLRKGRFDELFMVELPNAEERRSIFEIHLRKRGKLTDQVDVLKLLKDTEGYSGADIESLVKETIETAFMSDDKTVTTEKIKKVIEKTKSISVTMKEKINTLKSTYEKYDIKNAS